MTKKNENKMDRAIEKKKSKQKNRIGHCFFRRFPAKTVFFYYYRRERAASI